MKKKQHKHAAVIHAYADGAKIQWKAGNGAWVEPSFPDFDPEQEYRIAPDFPETRMTTDELAQAWQGGGGIVGVANAAIARAIRDRDVYLPPAGGEVVLLSQENGQDFFNVRGEQHVPVSMLHKVADRVMEHASFAATRHYEARTGQPQLGMISLQEDTDTIVANVIRGQA